MTALTRVRTSRVCATPVVSATGDGRPNGSLPRRPCRLLQTPTVRSAAGDVAGTVAFLVVMATCRAAYANSISPYLYLAPGISAIMCLFAFPASLLAALPEAPFLEAAGIKTRPLVLSLRANCVSTLVGIVLAPVGMAIYGIWPFIAIMISCMVEISYLRRSTDGTFRRSRLVIGNVVSSLVLLYLPLIAEELRLTYLCFFLLAERIKPYFDILWCIVSLASILVFLASFLVRVPSPLGATAAAADSCAETEQHEHKAAESVPVEAR